MAKQLEKTDKLVTPILERIEAGDTITSICQGNGMPSLSTFLRWCRSDDDFDNAVQRAWERGLFISIHRLNDKTEEVIKQLMAPDKSIDPKTAQALATLLRDARHNATALLTRLNKRFAERHEVAHTGPMVISWDNGPLSCPECGWTSAPVIEHEPAPPLPAPSTDLTGGEARCPI